MNPPGFAKSATVALLAPLALVVGREISRSQPDWWPGAPLNCLYLATPQILVVLVGLLYEPARRSSWLPLLLLTLLLLGFQAWAIWWVPPRESGLVWILYFPLALTVVVLSAAVQLAVKRWLRGVHISDNA